MDIVIKLVDVASEFVDEDDITGLTEEAYTRLSVCLQGWAGEVQVDSAKHLRDIEIALGRSR